MKSIFINSSRIWCVILCFFLGFTLVQCAKSPTDTPIEAPGISLSEAETDRISTASKDAGSQPIDTTPNQSSRENENQGDSFKDNIHSVYMDGEKILNTKKNIDLQERIIIETFDKLDKGVFFSNIPNQMKVGQEEAIEAGLIKEKTDLYELNLDRARKLTFEKEITYNPLAVEINLNVDLEKFAVKKISTGKKSTVTPNGKPELWKWQITPLTPGKSNIFLTANVSFEVPELEQVYYREINATTQQVSVKSNLLETIGDFIIRNWLKFLIVLLAPILGIFFWTLLLEKLLNRIITIKSDV